MLLDSLAEHRQVTAMPIAANHPHAMKIMTWKVAQAKPKEE